MIFNVEPMEVFCAVDFVLWFVSGLKASIWGFVFRAAGGWGSIDWNGGKLVPAGTTVSSRRCSRGILT